MAVYIWNRVFVKILSIPKYILLPCVFVLCVLGAYALKSNMTQVYACLIFGLLGFLFKKFEIPSTPFILGFILGPMAETKYRNGMMNANGKFFGFINFSHPIAIVFLAIAIFVVALAATKPMRAKAKANKTAA